MLWTADAAAAATGGQLIGDWAGVDGVSIDTRELAPGDLFVALAGDNRDGHDFVPAAIQAGAIAMVSTLSNCPDGPALLVEDTLAALERLGRAARTRTNARVIGVTGSVGKTSTKEMLRTALPGRVHAAVRSFNNHWGVPLTLARMPRETDFAVIEIGMNHPGEITPLSRLACPHMAIITTVEAVHMAAFDSVEQIADAKAEIFAGLEPDGTAILNADNPHFARLCAAAPGRIASFGRTGEARLVASKVTGDTTRVVADIRGQQIPFHLSVPGQHFAMNAVAVLAAADAVGVRAVDAASALADWMPPGGRGSREEINLAHGCLSLINESYNANPVSMRAALAVLATSGATRRIAFLGDMLELGSGEIAFHADLANSPDIARIDLIHTCGSRMQALHAALPVDKRGVCADDSAALAALVPSLLDAGDVAMVKGSLGARMAVVVDAIRALASQSPED